MHSIFIICRYYIIPYTEINYKVVYLTDFVLKVKSPYIFTNIQFGEGRKELAPKIIWRKLNSFVKVSIFKTCKEGIFDAG